MKRSWSFSLALGSSILVLALVLLARMVSQPAQAQSAQDTGYPTYGSEKAIAEALKVIREAQTDDGGIAGAEPEKSDMFTSIRSAIAVAQAGERLENIKKGNATLLGYLRDGTKKYIIDEKQKPIPGRVGMLLAAVAGGDQDPTDFGGVNLLDQLRSTYVTATGVYSPASVLGQLWAIIGLSAAGEPVPAKAVDWLVRQQLANGAWSLSTPEWADAESTAMVMVALLGSGHVQPTDEAIRKAIDFLREQQHYNGGWGIDWNTGLSPNVDATACVVQALAAAGYTPVAQSWMAEKNPREVLLGAKPKNALAAANIICGLVESPITSIGRQARAVRALVWASTMQDKVGAWGETITHTIHGILAYAAAGFDPNSVKRPGGKSPVEFLEDVVTSTAVMSPGSPPLVRADTVGQLILAAVAAGKNPRQFGKEKLNLVQLLLGDPYHPAPIPYSTEAIAYAILGLAAAGEQPTAYSSLVTSLRELQNRDGGWGYGKDSSPEATGLALQALSVITPSQVGYAVATAKGYLKNKQDPAGGWGDVESTAMVVEGLENLGEDLYGADWTTKEGRNAYHTLFAAQDSDGPFNGSWGDDDIPATFAAVQAIAQSYQYNRKFEGYGLYPDADRLVPSQPWATRNAKGEGTLVAPIGSDSNCNSSVKMEWAEIPSGKWSTVTETVRFTGAFTGAPKLSLGKSYRFRSTYADPDGIQTTKDLTTVVSMGYLGAAEATIRPAVSTPTQTVTLQYGTRNRGVAIAFPAQAVNRVTKFLYTPLTTPTVALTTTITSAGWNFLLQAAQGEELLDNLSLAKPVTITVTYSDEDIKGLDEEKLTLWYLDGKVWKNATNSCEKPTSYTRDPAKNTLSVPVCRTAEFALAGQKPEVVAEVAKVTLAPDPDKVITIPEGATLTITATVEDAKGTRLAGQTVVFTKTGTSSIAPATSTTDKNGQATTTLTGVEGWTTVGASSGKVQAKPVNVQVLKREQHERHVAGTHGKPGEQLSLEIKDPRIRFARSISVVFPAGLKVGATEVANVALTKLLSPTVSAETFPPNSMPMASFLLNLYDKDGNELSGLVDPPIPVTLVFGSVPQGYIALTMRAFYLDRGQWRNEGIFITNPSIDAFTFTTSHASEFAVFIANRVQVYLPVVQR